MRRFPFFMLLVCLLATTAFVFANNKKFANGLNLYIQDASSNYVQITDGTMDFLQLQIASPGQTQAALKGNGTSPRPLFHDNGTTKVAVSALGTW